MVSGERAPQAGVPAGGCRLERTKGGVAILTIENAPRRNSLSAEVEADLVDHLRSLSVDDACRAVVLTGMGTYFCAGGDLSRMADADGAAALAIVRGLHRIVLLIDEMPVPVVAAVEGGAAGGGISIVAASDFVVTASDARFVMAFDRIGLPPDLGAMWTMERRIGLTATRRLSYLGGTFDAAEAQQMGLVDQLCEPGSAMAAALSLAEDIAARPVSATAAIKRSLARPAPTLRAALESELLGCATLYSSDDYLASVHRLPR